MKYHESSWRLVTWNCVRYGVKWQSRRFIRGWNKVTFVPVFVWGFGSIFPFQNSLSESLLNNSRMKWTISQRTPQSLCFETAPNTESKLFFPFLAHFLLLQIQKSCNFKSQWQQKILGPQCVHSSCDSSELGRDYKCKATMRQITRKAKKKNKKATLLLVDV